MELDIPHKDIAQAKALGLRWDPDSRSWHVPPGSDLRPLAKWLPASTPDDPPLAIAGLPQPCWKCGAPTVAVVACKDDALEEWIFANAGVLEMLASQISSTELATAGAGPLRPRYSYFTKCSYWSNGCVKCDALLGELPLFEEFSEYMSHQRYELPVIAYARVLQDLV
jgi:hypothetical protein